MDLWRTAPSISLSLTWSAARYDNVYCHLGSESDGSNYVLSFLDDVPTLSAVGALLFLSRSGGLCHAVSIRWVHSCSKSRTWPARG